MLYVWLVSCIICEYTDSHSCRFLSSESLTKESSDYEIHRLGN